MATEDDSSKQQGDDGKVKYIVTATKINRVVGGQADLLTFGQPVMLDPNHPDTVRWLEARALVAAGSSDPTDSPAGPQEVPVVPPGNTGATPEAPNGTGDGQPSSVQNSDPNQPQGAAPTTPAAAKPAAKSGKAGSAS